MGTLEARRDQLLDRLAEELFAGIAEEALDLTIDQDDTALAVGHEEPARGGLDGRRKSLFQGSLWFEASQDS